MLKAKLKPVTVAVILIVIIFTGFWLTRHNEKHTQLKAPMPSVNLMESSNTTGIYGNVGTTGCPAQQVNNPCPVKPIVAGVVTITNLSDKTSVTVNTDTMGNYHVITKPGTYSLSARSAKTNVIAECQNEDNLAVGNGMEVRYNFICSNGIE